MADAPRRLPRYTLGVLLVAALVIPFLLVSEEEEPRLVAFVEADPLRLPRVRRKAGRAEYFNRMLRDPETGAIPHNIRMRELAYAQTLPTTLGKTGAGVLTWTEAGPYDVGGRTRALAVDVRNSDVILAGGTSGGMWKSVDGGDSWTLKSDVSQQFDVTWLAQDTRAGHRDTWYYVSGEFEGSAGGLQGSARYYGSGIYKSTDNGESWSRIQGAGSSVDADTEFDFLSKVIVHPTTGSVFVAANNYGILRSDDGGDSWVLVLGGLNEHTWSDIVFTADGRLLAVVMPGSNPVPDAEPGVYVSDDDGQSWARLSIGGFTDLPVRGVLAAAPSDPDVAYLLTQTEPPGFYRFELDAGSAEDRSANMPAFDDQDGKLNFQGGYNMVMAVKPDDENFVLIGATSLFRSRDGFATPADDRYEHWIGGYNSSQTGPLGYPNHHADQHVIVFDPDDPNRMWTGHDGGISLLEDVRSREQTVPWIDRNNGFNITQFYTVAIHDDEGDPRLVGGTQDNGSPFFQFNGSTATPSVDASSGDGAAAYLGDEYAYVSAQQGAVQRVPYLSDGTLDTDNASVIQPIGLELTPLFINPFAIDPADEDVMFYPELERLWRNTNLSGIPNGVDGTSVGWERLDGLGLTQNHLISALAVSADHRLYVGASPDAQTGDPKLFRMDEARTSDQFVDVSIPDAHAGSFVHDLSIHPEDSDEILVVISNYGVPSVFHSDDGGTTYASIEGNLAGNLNDGPSVRSAAILPSGGQTLYLAATSTGVYSTNVLAGENTVWEQEGAETIGHAVVSRIRSRPSDGLVAAGTHGRGVFVGQAITGNLAPSANFTVEKSTTDPYVVTFDGSTSRDPNGDALTYSWDFGDGTSASGAVVTHTFTDTGQFEITLDVTDPDGLSDDTSLDLEVTGVLSVVVRGFDPNRAILLDGYDAVEPVDSGFVYGPNLYGQSAFATALTVPEHVSSGRVSQVRALFFYKRDGFTDETYRVAIYNGDAASGPVGEPLYETTVLYADINADENYNEINGWTDYPIGPAVAVGETFFVVVDFGTVTEADWGGVGLAQGEFTTDASVWIRDEVGFYNNSECCQGESLVFDATVLYGGQTGTRTEEGVVPTTIALDLNYPNPFNPTTRIGYTLPSSGPVSLRVYDMLGREVATIVDGVQPAGRHEATFDASNVASGVYVYRLHAGSQSIEQQMVVAK